jgi:hypothetical protein
MMGDNVVLGWLTLELTNSPLMVGTALGVRALPLFLIGVPAGALADRYPRHRLLVLTSAGQALLAATLGGLVISGTVTLGQVFLLSFLAGTLRAVEHAARQSYTHDVVGAGALVSGLAVLGVAMRSGWLVGSLMVGVAIARYGTGAAYGVVAAGFLLGGLSVLGVTAPSRPRGGPQISLWRSTAEFARAIARDRTLLILMMLTGGAEVLGFAHQTLLPSLARDVLHAGPEGLGALNAARAVGGILALLVTSFVRVAEGMALMLGVLVMFGVSLIVMGVSPYVVGFAGVLLVVTLANACGALVDLLAQSLLQRSVPAELRGRAGGAWVVAIGLAPLGQVQIGALASLFGVSIALGASGLALVALAIVGVLLTRKGVSVSRH